jgi:hypothetical protein
MDSSMNPRASTILGIEHDDAPGCTGVLQGGSNHPETALHLTGTRFRNVHSSSSREEQHRCQKMRIMPSCETRWLLI